MKKVWIGSKLPKGPRGEASSPDLSCTKWVRGEAPSSISSWTSWARREALSPVFSWVTGFMGAKIVKREAPSLFSSWGKGGRGEAPFSISSWAKGTRWDAPLPVSSWAKKLGERHHPQHNATIGFVYLHTPSYTLKIEQDNSVMYTSDWPSCEQAFSFLSFMTCQCGWVMLNSSFFCLSVTEREKFNIVCVLSYQLVQICKKRKYQG